jgi:hypothetical protein
VKYAQGVKIWSFDVLVLFLKCVQFLKPCVQFLMDTILNLVIVQFLMKKKGDTLLLRASLILRHMDLLPLQTCSMQRAHNARGRRFMWSTSC